MSERSGYAKVATILAIVFGVSLGLCGLNVAVSLRLARGGGPLESALAVAAWIEGFAIVLSFLGLLATLILWSISALFGKGQGSDPGLQRLFEDEKQERKPK